MSAAWISGDTKVGAGVDEHLPGVGGDLRLVEGGGVDHGTGHARLTKSRSVTEPTRLVKEDATNYDPWSCCMNPAMSATDQCSAILPPRKRSMRMDASDTGFPVGGLPNTVPV